MSTYFTEAEEFSRQTRVAEQLRHHVPPRPHARPRTRVAATLRRLADRLEQ